MNDRQTKQRYVWPAIFFGAFFFGAVLWCLWMYNVIHRSRQQRQEGYFVPTRTAPGVPAIPTNAAPAQTNPPVAR